MPTPTPPRIAELIVPAAPGDPGWDDFVEMTRVRNDIEAGIVGDRVLAAEPAELLPPWHDPHEPARLLLARVDGRIVGRGGYMRSTDPADPSGWLTIEVLEAFRGRGIGSALYEGLLSLLHDDRRTVVQTSFLGRSRLPGPRIDAPTGFGSVPALDDGVRFALARGFELQQIYRASRIDLPIPASQIAGLRPVADGYRVVSWEGRTPEHWIDDIALLHSRMATDAPSAGLDISDEPWDADRVRDQDDRDEIGTRLRLVSAAEHVSTGRLAGFTELSVPADRSRPVAQFDTLVLSEHRGNRLGMLLKLANLDEVQRRHPGHPCVTTFNAEENRYMLSVNETVGFEAFGYESAWRLALLAESAH